MDTTGNKPAGSEESVKQEIRSPLEKHSGTELQEEPKQAQGGAQRKSHVWLPRH